MATSADEIVGPSVLPARRHHAERHAEDDGEDDRRKHQLERRGKGIADVGGDLPLAEQRAARDRHAPAPTTNSPYCSTSGRSRPSLCCRSATCSCVAVGPSAMRAGSPGTTRAITKIIDRQADQHQDRPQHAPNEEEQEFQAGRSPVARYDLVPFIASVRLDEKRLRYLPVRPVAGTSCACRLPLPICAGCSQFDRRGATRSPRHVRVLLAGPAVELEVVGEGLHRHCT